MKPTDAQCDRAALMEQLDTVLKIRNALQYSGLCGPDTDEDNDGREAAHAVMQALAMQRVILYPLPEPEPAPVPPPSLKERLASGASTMGHRLTSAAARHRPQWTRRASRRKS